MDATAVECSAVLLSPDVYRFRATGATVEGDITAQYIADIAASHEIPSSRLARGIPIGGELEFVDSGTLSRALSGRQQIDQS